MGGLATLHIPSSSLELSPKDWWFHRPGSGLGAQPWHDSWLGALLLLNPQASVPPSSVGGPQPFSAATEETCLMAGFQPSPRQTPWLVPQE